ncbi:MAG: hypothetical protein IJP68_02630, partial [Selenomonadaceae bacterium]|nr:hypothetical protein [Selenomonadaceae bacterium]
VAYNEIKGNTDADIKNSNLEVGGSTAEKDLIAVSNPQDSLINSYVTRDTWTSDGLFKGRKTSKKSGLVVNSSATHSISSDLATIGIRANTEKMGVGISGTLNINKIGGATNAKVENTEVTADKADAFVNAADYTKNGSFVGNAAVSGTVAIGFLWNENQINRETNALVGGTDDSYKPTLKVKNLDVKADAQQGLSNLNIAVGASFTADEEQVFAAASGDNIVRNQLEGTTTAKLENATVEHSGNVDVNAYHKDNAFATNIAVGGAVDAAGKVGASFDLGYGLMRADSTVKAEINNSTLTSKEKGAVNVNAENNSKITGAFGTAGLAAHIGGVGATAAIALGINNNYIENKVNASINNSTLDVGAVNVDANNTSTVKADGGVAAVAATLSKSFFAALGTSVAVTNATFDNKVTAEVNKSTIDAAGDVNINARDDHKSDETVVSAAASTGIGVAVNRMSTSVNSGLTNLKAEDLGKTLTAGSLVTRANNATPGSSLIDLKQLNGEFGAEDRFIKKETIDKFFTGIHTNSEETKNNIENTLNTRHDAPENYGLDKKSTTTEVIYNNKLGSGVFANVVNGSTINAGDNKISIGSTE